MARAIALLPEEGGLRGKASPLYTRRFLICAPRLLLTPVPRLLPPFARNRLSFQIDGARPWRLRQENIPSLSRYKGIWISSFPENPRAIV